jgi:hypothetical protein
LEYVTDILNIPICTIASCTAKGGGARAFLPDEKYTCYLWGSEQGGGGVCAGDRHQRPWRSLNKHSIGWRGRGRR